MRVRIGLVGRCVFSSSIIQQVEYLSFSFFGKWTADTSQRIPPSISSLPLLIQSEFKPQPLAAAAKVHSRLECEKKGHYFNTFILSVHIIIVRMALIFAYY